MTEIKPSIEGLLLHLVNQVFVTTNNTTNRDETMSASNKINETLWLISMVVSKPQ